MDGNHGLATGARQDRGRECTVVAGNRTHGSSANLRQSVGGGFEAPCGRMAVDMRAKGAGHQFGRGGIAMRVTMTMSVIMSVTVIVTVHRRGLGPFLQDRGIAGNGKSHKPRRKSIGPGTQHETDQGFP